MNSMQRVLSTLQGKALDRRAVSLTLSLYGAKLTNCPLHQYYSDPKAYALGQTAVRETIRPDILFGPFALALEGEVFGSQIRMFDNQAPNLSAPAIACTDKIRHLDVPDIETHPRLIYFREAIKQMAQEHGKEVPIAAIALNPADIPVMILSIDGWLSTLLFDDEGTQIILEATIPYFVKRINSLFANGASFIVMPAAFTNPSIVTREIALKKTIPALKRAFSQVNGPLVMHSGGATIVPFIDLFADLPNVVGFVVSGGENLSQARNKIGTSPALIGNVEGPALFARSPEEIKAECASILQDRIDDPHFILGSSGADVSYDTPVENIVAMRQAVENFY